MNAAYVDGDFEIGILFRYRGLQISLTSEEVSTIKPASFDKACRVFVEMIYSERREDDAG